MAKNSKRLILLSLLAMCVLGTSYNVNAYNFGSEQSGKVSGPTPAYYLRNLIQTGEPYDSYAQWQTTRQECRNGACTTTPKRPMADGDMTSANCENAATQAGFSESAAITCTETTRGIWQWHNYPNGWGGTCTEYACAPYTLMGLEYTVAVYPGHLSPNQVCPEYEDYPPPQAWFYPGQVPEQHLPTCKTYRHGNAVPTATLSANPTNIATGGTSSLTHACTNSTSASISGIGPVAATNGTTSVTPNFTTTYTLTCNGPSGSATASATVNVTPSPALFGSCTVNPSSISSGGQATWSASAFGGTGNYTYSWSGTDGLSGSGPAVTKTYATQGTHTASVTITSGTATITQACSNALTVTAPQNAQADLTAGSVSGPASGAVGQSINFSAPATNIGTASAGQFPILFRIGNALQESGYLAALAQGATAWGGITYAFQSPGTYQVSACANFNANWTNITPESNYGNNCGPSYTITITGPEEPPANTLSCTVSNTNPAVGESVTYSASGASAPYAWSPSDGIGSYGTGSTASRTFDAEGSFGMSVSKNGYTSGNCPVVTAGAISCGTADATLTATPNRVRAGQTTTLSWSASGVDDSCTISGPGVSQTVAGNACVVPSGSATPTINTQSVYRINCDDGEAVKEVIVNVIPQFDEF